VLSLTPSVTNRPHAPADPVAGFDHRHADAARLEITSRGEPGQTGTDHHDVRSGDRHHVECRTKGSRSRDVARTRLASDAGYPIT
jgi:hypothetical protein